MSRVIIFSFSDQENDFQDYFTIAKLTMIQFGKDSTDSISDLVELLKSAMLEFDRKIHGPIDRFIPFFCHRIMTKIEEGELRAKLFIYAVDPMAHLFFKVRPHRTEVWAYNSSPLWLLGTLHHDFQRHVYYYEPYKNEAKIRYFRDSGIEYEDTFRNGRLVKRATLKIGKRLKVKSVRELKNGKWVEEK